ncbi:Acetyltransferase (GNAT) domain-containing protein [Paenibacillus sp. UNC496MF]|uniref:GNAT family N-acetyltransferase n=1 Tax=Paenibacillus sp. UNC496MF TaxID=1502753 RepID=UPI0008ED4A0C|nr:GNAT family N-acetyltransferase [Paenibacillus sp. UNC496MF]SFI39714.1 Acetyltransferase (GNAT) domain-containing protein [Paenibacillus sp. UNC496MF]
MYHPIVINLPIAPDEVPALREHIGWEGRHADYPRLFERCNFWAGCRNERRQLIAFGYISGMGLQHGYMEDVMVHPNYRRSGLGQAVVRALLEEAERFGLDIVTLTFENKLTAFYEGAGFASCAGGVWRRDG